jgi:phage gp46-like protein
MAFDIAVSDHGDLIFSAAKDLQYVDGKPLLEQRMLVRLVLTRGAWILDRDSDLGSELRFLLGRRPGQIEEDAKNYVRIALEPMQDEIEIHDVAVTQTSETELEISVAYQPIIPDAPPALRQEISTVLLSVPLTGSGS